MSNPPSSIEQRLKSIEDERLATQKLRIKTRLKEGELLKDLVSRFNHDFNHKKQAILRELERMRPLEEELLPACFESLVPLVKELTVLLNEAVIFLPPFEIRVAREGIDRIEETIADTRAKLLPRKKFKFSQKAIKALGESAGKSVPKVTENTEIEEDNADDNFDLSLSVVDLVNDIVYRAPNSLPMGADFAVARLTDCSISICAPLTALRIHQLVRCTVYIGPVTGSVHLEECRDCVFVMASQQVRIHHTHDCDLYLQIRSGPIIEHCSKLRFAPYILEYNELADQLENAKLAFDYSESKWANVQDFRWLRVQQSPNWSILPEASRLLTVNPITNQIDKQKDTKYRDAIKTTEKNKTNLVKPVHTESVKTEKVVGGASGEVMEEEDEMGSDDEM